MEKGKSIPDVEYRNRQLNLSVMAWLSGMSDPAFGLDR
jgi:hypothetical protein